MSASVTQANEVMFAYEMEPVSSTKLLTVPTETYPAFGPKAAQRRDALRQSWNVTMIDRSAGGRNNLIIVFQPNPKKPGSKADLNWGLYGKLGKPTVTVDAFLKSYPAADGGLTRARASLAYDINYGYVGILNVATGEVITALKED